MKHFFPGTYGKIIKLCQIICTNK